MDGSERRRLQSGLSRLADGDRDAFPPVFHALWPLLRRFAGRMLQDDALAEDVAQQTLLKVFSHAARFDARRDALSWVLAIAANECRATRRWRQRRREDPLPSAAPHVEDGDPEQALLAAEMTDILRATLAGLSPEDLRTLLVAVGGAARDPGLPPATFRKRLQRATARLRLAFRAGHGDV